VGENYWLAKGDEKLTYNVKRVNKCSCWETRTKNKHCWQKREKIVPGWEKARTLRMLAGENGCSIIASWL